MPDPANDTKRVDALSGKKSADRLSFPVLTVSRRGEMEVVDDSDRLQTGNARAIKNGFFDGQTIIELSGDSYRVVEVKKKRPKGKWWGYQFLKPRLYSLELIVTPGPRVSLEEVQQIASSNVKRYADLWAGAWDIAELESKIRSTMNLKQLFDILHD